MCQVDYQNEQPDRFHHRYRGACPELRLGDADNRIIEVKTSADAADWHTDARYHYYPHGPLARVELGDHLVQGLDYAYTLQGWLKGINGERLNPGTDMGRDGDPSVTNNPNLLVGRDAYALTLGYYGDADYKAIGNVWNTVTDRPFAPIGADGTNNTLANAHEPLYNGNIAHTVNTLQPFGLWNSGNGSQGQVLAQVYRYDQLNRLKKARGVTGIGSGNTWRGVNDDANPNRYRSQYEYDANGNILTAERWNADGTARYDSLHYHYHDAGGRRQRNRLYHLQDLAADGVVTAPDPDDLKKTTLAFDADLEEINTSASTNNYRYDALGNLIFDEREGITGIEWSVAGKVRSVTKATGPSLAFAYGASGQRTQKQVSDPDLDATGYREHYIRDAQGNIMATYRYTNNGGASLKLNERPLYGSSRLGSLRKEEELYTLLAYDPEEPNTVQQVDLNYELTDHLGNVCAVVTGRLLDGNGGGTPKQAELLSAQGYEPFGSLLPGRNYSSGSYRYLFQGQEHDDEINGSTGTSYAFEYRMHDPRIGRFLSIDPLAAKYPHNSPYAFSENKVIQYVELEGLETGATDISGQEDPSCNQECPDAGTSTEQPASGNSWSLLVGSTYGPAKTNPGPTSIWPLYGGQTYYNNTPNGGARLDEPNGALQFEWHERGSNDRWAVSYFKQKMYAGDNGFKLVAPVSVQFGYGRAFRLAGGAPGSRGALSATGLASFGAFIAVPWFDDPNKGAQVFPNTFKIPLFSSGDEKYWFSGFSTSMIARVDYQLIQNFSIWTALTVNHVQTLSMETSIGRQPSAAYGSVAVTAGVGFNVNTRVR